MATFVNGIQQYPTQIDTTKLKFTVEGGLALKLTNKTGGNSVKGTAVKIGSTDNSFTTSATTEYTNIGFVYENGIADSSECWIVISGVAEALLKDSTGATRGDWCGTSTDTTGRIIATTIPSPPNADTHFREVGHALESKSSGTDVLCKIIIHHL